jgi:epoxyqueuosine reductase
MKKEVSIDPTYTGHNEGCVFVVPAKLLQMKLQGTVPQADVKAFAQYINGTFVGFDQSRKTKFGNEGKTKTKTTPAFWKEFEQATKALGVDLIGYTPVQENFIFKGMSVYGKNAIVLGMELKWDAIKTAPGYQCGMEAFRVYKALGDVVLPMTDWLKERGYKAEAHHPFGGKLLYPVHAVVAGLGVVGRLGLILTPEFGPRQRFGMITTDADLPATKSTRNLEKVIHACDKCSACIQNCPAALPNPTERVPGSGVITRIDRDACEGQLVNNNYCSKCLKACPPGRPKSS